MTELHVIYALICFYILIIFINLINIYIDLNDLNSRKKKRNAISKVVDTSCNINCCDDCIWCGDIHNIHNSY